MVEHDSIGLLLGRFGLTSLRTHLPEVEAAAQNGSWSYRQFLRELLEAEEAARSRRRLKRLLKESQLPEAKTAANLELKRFSQATRQAFSQLCDGSFCEAAQNVLAFGLPGRGKSHFLAAVGHELILRHQKRVLFVPTFKLVQRLLEAKRKFELESQLKKLDGFEAVILDDLGYVQQSREEMEVLFTFFAERYERRSLLISSNLVFSQWEKIFQDPMTTMAAIDRLVHHSIILEFDGDSYRASTHKRERKSSASLSESTTVTVADN
jgi:DNA replication protein DnaC